jgi:hypothetical protein
MHDTSTAPAIMALTARGDSGLAAELLTDVEDCGALVFESTIAALQVAAMAADFALHRGHRPELEDLARIAETVAQSWAVSGPPGYRLTE